MQKIFLLSKIKINDTLKLINRFLQCPFLISHAYDQVFYLQMLPPGPHLLYQISHTFPVLKITGENLEHISVSLNPENYRGEQEVMGEEGHLYTESCPWC